MEFWDVIQNRYSCRSFTSQAPASSDLEQIMSAGGQAPVGKHRYETLQFTLIQNPDLLNRVRAAIDRQGHDPSYGVPAIIFVSSSLYPDPFAFQDAACAIDHMSLAATALGLGNVYLYGFVRDMCKNRELLDAFELPGGFHPVAGLGIGYPAKTHTPKTALQSQVNIHRI